MKHIKLFESFVNEMEFSEHMRQRIELRLRDMKVINDGNSGYAAKQILERVNILLHHLVTKLKNFNFTGVGAVDLGDIVLKDDRGTFYPVFGIQKESGSVDTEGNEGNCFLVPSMSNTAQTIYIVPAKTDAKYKLGRIQAHRRRLGLGEIEQMQIVLLDKSANMIDMGLSVVDYAASLNKIEYKHTGTVTKDVKRDMKEFILNHGTKLFFIKNDGNISTKTIDKVEYEEARGIQPAFFVIKFVGGGPGMMIKPGSTVAMEPKAGDEFDAKIGWEPGMVYKGTVHHIGSDHSTLKQNGRIIPNAVFMDVRQLVELN